MGGLRQIWWDLPDCGPQVAHFGQKQAYDGESGDFTGALFVVQSGVLFECFTCADVVVPQ